MKHKTFFWFILPTFLAMFFFIMLPIISICLQSIHTPHENVLVTVENCDPFGCKKSTSIDHNATNILKDKNPLGKFVGFDIYLDRGHLAIEKINEIWMKESNFFDFLASISNLPLYKAIFFTLTFTFTVTPIMLILGLLVALGVNSINKQLRGMIIFFSLLPMIVTPLIGSIILFWMIDSRGIIGNLLQIFLDDPNFSLKASTNITWLMLILYGVWHAIPFSFIVFYAGLQTLPKDQIESAQIDGANNFQQTIHIIIPHLMPLITFVTLMQLMDNFRVFEPIIGFNAEAHATSLSWIIFNDLGGETRQLSAAATSSILTIIGVIILLLPVLIKTWKEFEFKK
tara:strand:+ start:3968 stop:4993 length:1026 start_codon:yes stop_codon:yes gene_type:complete